MATDVEELEAAGWQRLGTYSTWWKAPDDTGPTGRKWKVGQAYREMTAREAAKPKVAKKPAAKAKAKKADDDG